MTSDVRAVTTAPILNIVPSPTAPDANVTATTPLAQGSVTASAVPAMMRARIGEL